MKTWLLTMTARGGALFYALLIGGLSLLPSETPRGTSLPSLESLLHAMVDRGPIAIATVLAVGVAPFLVLLLTLFWALRRPASPLWPALALVGGLAGAIAALGFLPAFAEPDALIRSFGELSTDHAVAYAVFGLCLLLGWSGRTGPVRLGALGLAFGVVLELLQVPLPGRSANMWDLLANGVGMVVGLAVGALIMAQLGRRRARDAVPPAPPGAELPQEVTPAGSPS